VPLADDIRRDGGPFQPGRIPQLAVSAGGTLAYVPGGGQSDGTLGIVSRDGTFEAIGRRDQFSRPRVSPDGRTIAVTVRRRHGQEVLLVDTMRGTTTRLTRDGSDATPAWRPDGRALAMSSVRGETRGIVLKELDGGERFLVETSGLLGFLRNMSWTPDGRQLAYTRQTTAGHDIWLVTPTTRRPRSRSSTTPGWSTARAFSPDGRWLAYVSDESGRPGDLGAAIPQWRAPPGVGERRSGTGLEPRRPRAVLPGRP
jgi:eukaryotic-like serine/threonine-protein kinase